MLKLLFKISGRKKYAHLEGTEKELRLEANRLRVEVKQDARGLHCDLTEHQAELAERHGAERRQQ